MHSGPMPRSLDSGTVNVRPQRPSCRTTSSGWIEEEWKKKSNAFEAAPQESAVLKCRPVRYRTLSLTSRPIDLHDGGRLSSTFRRHQIDLQSRRKPKNLIGQMSDLSSIIKIEQLKAEIERLKAIYDHDSTAICEKDAEIKRMKDLLIRIADALAKIINDFRADIWAGVYKQNIEMAEEAAKVAGQ
jgi:hypothetical protein